MSYRATSLRFFNFNFYDSRGTLRFHVEQKIDHGHISVIYVPLDQSWRISAEESTPKAAIFFRPCKVFRVPSGDSVRIVVLKKLWKSLSLCYLSLSLYTVRPCPGIFRFPSIQLWTRSNLKHICDSNSTTLRHQQTSKVSPPDYSARLSSQTVSNVSIKMKDEEE